MKVRVDNDRCTGHGRCNAAAPELFTVDDAGFVELDEAEIDSPERQRQAERGALACPEQAISIER